MFEYILKKYFRDFIVKYKNNDIIKKELILLVFFWNMAIYSIPLVLLDKYIIKVPEIFLNYYSIFIAKILDKLNIIYHLENNIIKVKNIDFLIEQECIGLKSILGMFALIFSTPVYDVNKKIIYSALFLPIVYILNIIRIVSFIYLYYYINADVYFIHDILWSFFSTFSVIFLWFIFFIKNKNDLFINKI